MQKAPVGPNTSSESLGNGSDDVLGLEDSVHLTRSTRAPDCSSIDHPPSHRRMKHGQGNGPGPGTQGSRS
jgi:hypothetical protein